MKFKQNVFSYIFSQFQHLVTQKYLGDIFQEAHSVTNLDGKIIIFKLGFKPNLIQWVLSVSVCTCVRGRVRFVYESMYSHVYSIQQSLRGIPIDLYLESKKINFGPFFRSKYAPNLKFSSSRGGFTIGQVMVIQPSQHI